MIVSRRALSRVIASCSLASSLVACEEGRPLEERWGLAASEVVADDHEDCGCDAPPPDVVPQDAERAEPDVAADAARRWDVEVGGAMVRGPQSAPVTLVVFSDYQCPYCAKLAGTLDELLARYPRELRVAQRHRPLPFHDRAEPLALAVLAARRQDKGWEVHDALFADRKVVAPALVPDALDLAGVDARALERAAAAPATLAMLEADEREAERLGVRGTPTTFVNGLRVVGARDAAFFQRMIDAEIGGAVR